MVESAEQGDLRILPLRRLGTGKVVTALCLGLLISGTAVTAFVLREVMGQHGPLLSSQYKDRDSLVRCCIFAPSMVDRSLSSGSF